MCHPLPSPTEPQEMYEHPGAHVNTPGSACGSSLAGKGCDEIWVTHVTMFSISHTASRVRRRQWRLLHPPGPRSPHASPSTSRAHPHLHFHLLCGRTLATLPVGLCLPFSFPGFIWIVYPNCNASNSSHPASTYRHILQDGEGMLQNNFRTL